MERVHTSLYLRNLRDWAAELEEKYGQSVEISRDRNGYIFVVQTEYDIDIPGMYRSIPVRKQLVKNGG